MNPAQRNWQEMCSYGCIEFLDTLCPTPPGSPPPTVTQTPPPVYQPPVTTTTVPGFPNPYRTPTFPGGLPQIPVRQVPTFAPNPAPTLGGPLVFTYNPTVTIY